LLRLGSSSNHCGRGGDSVLRDGCSELAVQPLPLPLPSTTDLEPIARRVADAAGLAVVGVQLHTHRIPITVQVQVRRADGSDVNLDDCAALTAPLGEALEASALLEGAYVLEVSSPGIGDDLQTDRDFVSFRGFPVAVERRGAEGSSSILEGLLLGRDGDTVHLNMRGRPVRVPRQEVVRVHLVSPRDGP
jgi:ribosome maturation factor RimP